MFSTIVSIDMILVLMVNQILRTHAIYIEDSMINRLNLKPYEKFRILFRKALNHFKDNEGIQVESGEP